jgi:hypothetical protein
MKIVRSSRRLFNFGVAGALGLIAFVSQSPLRADACSGSHGVGSSVLCNGDDMFGSGAYLVSPNHNVRLYMQADGMRQYDTSTNPATQLWTLYAGSLGNPSRLRGLGNYFQIWDSSENTLLQLNAYGGNLSDGHLLLLDDGCLWFANSSDQYSYGICETGS